MSHCCYGRVSTQEQSENSNAATQQISRLTRTGAEKIFFDIQSGKDDSRPQFEQMISEIKAGIWKKVTVTRDDRLTRRGITTLNLLETFAKLGTQLEILDSGGISDLANPYEWIQRAQAGINAEYETRMLSMRIRYGFEFLRSEKKANPRPPFGYLRVSEKYKINELEKEIALETIKVFIETQTLRKTCLIIKDKYGKRWTARGLLNWLLNPVLLGHTPYIVQKVGTYKNIVYDTHPEESLLNQETLELIKDIYTENAAFRGKNSTAPKYPLTGIVFCKECNAKMNYVQAKKPKKTYTYYFCGTRKEDIRLCSQDKCISVTLIEKTLINFLSEYSEKIIPEFRFQDELSEDPKITELKRQLDLLLSLPANEVLETAIAKTKEQIYQLQSSSEMSSQNKNIKFIEIKNLLSEVFSNPQFFIIQSEDYRRTYYRKVIDKIYIINGDVVEVKLQTGEIFYFE